MTQAQKTQNQQEHHDIVCLGFGPAAISLGIALKEDKPTTDIVFLEHANKTTWRPLADVPGHVHMGSNFLNDLVTLENPRSSFTFIRYLHQRKLLVDFTNLGSMQPSRELFERYIMWCSRAFEGDVRYSSRILSIEPTYTNNRKIDGWNVFTTNRDDGSHALYTAKRVVICMSQQPSIPAVFANPTLEKLVVHSSNSSERVAELTQSSLPGVRIAIVGQTQQAAELFEELYDVRAGRQVVWLVEDETLRPQTTVPLNAKDPLIAEDISNVPPELRIPTVVAKKSSTVLDEALIKRLYESQYAQSIKNPDCKDWDFRIVFNRKVISAEKSESGRLHLTHQDKTSLEQTVDDFDLLVSATGFSRVAPQSLLSSLTSKRLLDGSSITVDAEYAINIRRGVLEPGVGLWCIGSIGDTEHAVGDGAFRVMAERSARLTSSLKHCVAQEIEKKETSEPVQAQL